MKNEIGGQENFIYTRGSGVECYVGEEGLIEWMRDLGINLSLDLEFWVSIRLTTVGGVITIYGAIRSDGWRGPKGFQCDHIRSPIRRQVDSQKNHLGRLKIVHHFASGKETYIKMHWFWDTRGRQSRVGV